jgi:hypothetical protein
VARKRWTRVEPRRAAVWAGVVLVLVLGGWLARQWRPEREAAPVSSPATSSTGAPQREATAGQEVAPLGGPPESGWAAAPPPVESTSAAVASSAAPRKDSAHVKKQHQTSGPQRETRPRSLGAAARNACLGLTGAALQACLSAQQQVPPVRSAPPPQECPAGAVETMTGLLGLRLGEIDSVQWSDARGRGIPVREDSTVEVPGHWMTSTGQIALPNRTRLSGRLYFGEKRVYGRFTEARTPSGDTYKICMELLDTDGKVGLEIYPDSEPGNIKVAPIAEVRVVDHFE